MNSCLGYCNSPLFNQPKPPNAGAGRISEQLLLGRGGLVFEPAFLEALAVFLLPIFFLLS
jgi:hypothetical protein